MSINYQILLNYPSTHVVTLRWTDGSNFRDEAFDLNFVYPGAAQMFVNMGLDFNYDAALTYLQRRCQEMISAGALTIAPPMWDASVPYQQIISTTPDADRPAPAQTPTTDPNQSATDDGSGAA